MLGKVSSMKEKQVNSRTQELIDNLDSLTKERIVREMIALWYQLSSDVDMWTTKIVWFREPWWWPTRFSVKSADSMVEAARNTVRDLLVPYSEPENKDNNEQ